MNRDIITIMDQGRNVSHSKRLTDDLLLSHWPTAKRLIWPTVVFNESKRDLELGQFVTIATTSGTVE